MFSSSRVTSFLSIFSSHSIFLFLHYLDSDLIRFFPISEPVSLPFSPSHLPLSGFPLCFCLTSFFLPFFPYHLNVPVSSPIFPLIFYFLLLSLFLFPSYYRLSSDIPCFPFWSDLSLFFISSYFFFHQQVCVATNTFPSFTFHVLSLFSPHCCFLPSRFPPAYCLPFIFFLNYNFPSHVTPSLLLLHSPHIYFLISSSF